MPDATMVDAIVDSIRGLTPAQRRTLARRLRVSGLLQFDDLSTDQRRMSVAPALGGMRAAKADVAPMPPPVSAAQALPRAPLRMAAPRDANHQPTVSGHVVLGAPSGAANAAPHQMAPLPGQAPEAPIVVILRGLIFPNGATASAEYILQWPGYAPQPVQMRFAGQPTPDQALYDTLEKALRAVLARLRDSGADPATARLEVYCPSDRFIDEVIDEAFAGVKLRGRAEVISHQPLVILDAAHNPDAAQALGETLSDEFDVIGARLAVVGLLAGRDPLAYAQALLGARLDSVIITQPPSPRAAELAPVVEAFTSAGLSVESVADPETALARAMRHTDEEDLLVVAGSMTLLPLARDVIEAILEVAADAVEPEFHEPD